MGYGNMSTFGNNSIRVISAAMGNAVYGNVASKSNSVSTPSQNYNGNVETYDFNNNYNSQTETIPSNGVSKPNGSEANPETMRVEPAKEVVPDSFEPGSSKDNGDVLVPANPNSDSNGDSFGPANPDGGETIPNNGVRPLNPDLQPKTPGSSDGILTPNNPNLTNTSTSNSTTSYSDGNLRDTGIHLERPIPHILGDKK